MMQNKHIAWMWLLVACSGESLDIGHDVSNQSLAAGTGGGGGGSSGNKGGTGGSTVSPASAPWPAQSGCATDPELAGLVGTWDGDLEDFFLKPLEHVTLVINGASSDGICGSFTWGDKPAFPPADNPDALYPPADNWQSFGWGGAANQMLPPVEGFPYTITDSGERLPTVRLGITQSEPWTSFCAIQTPVRDGAGWTCDHVCRDASDVNATTQFLCGACDPLAGAICTCDPASCDVVRSSPQSFDLQLSKDGKTLTGVYQPSPAMPAASWQTASSPSFNLTRVEQ
jgi:hypothetical protein